MKCVTLVFLCCALAAASARPEDKYTSKYDNVDLTEILGNRRLLVPYVKCALEQGRCTPDGLELRSRISDALQTGCAKCTATQRDGSRRVIGHLINNEPEYWQQLTNKYDKDHKFVKQYEAELRTVKA